MAGRILLLQPGIEPVPPALEAWCLNHWTTREVPPLPIIVSPQVLINKTPWGPSAAELLRAYQQTQVWIMTSWHITSLLYQNNSSILENHFTLKNNFTLVMNKCIQNPNQTMTDQHPGPFLWYIKKHMFTKPLLCPDSEDRMEKTAKSWYSQRSHFSVKDSRYISEEMSIFLSLFWDI